MEDYNKIIESLGVKFVRARNIQILQPITFKNFYDVQTALTILYDGEVSFGDEVPIKIEKGDMLFIPGGKHATVTYGNKALANPVTNEEFMTNRDVYFQAIEDPEKIGDLSNSFGLISFKERVFDKVIFFIRLEFPPFSFN